MRNISFEGPRQRPMNEGVDEGQRTPEKARVWPRFEVELLWERPRSDIATDSAFSPSDARTCLTEGFLA